jgi:mannose-6-phosphate isomerase-like protein (cupin superfamily)
MEVFQTKRLPENRDDVAPDGSDVRILLQATRGGMAHFHLAPGQTSKPISHKTVEEIWFILGGHGEMWRKQDRHEETIPLSAGLCLTIPLGTHFQFRSIGTEPLSALGVTMPPWPGRDEAFEVNGPWEPSA